MTEQKRFEIKDEFGPAEVRPCLELLSARILTIPLLGQMIGYVDRDTYDAGIVLFVAGIQIGPFYGNLEESGEEIRINLELRAVTGHVVLCLSDDNEVYTRYSLTVKLGGVWDGQHKLSDTL